MRRRDFVRTGIAATLVGPSLAPGPLTSQMRYRLEDLVVLLPGIGGSVLQKDGRDVWALSGSAIASGLRTFGQNLATSLRLVGDTQDRADIGDGISATRLLPDTHLLPGLWKIDGYTQIRRTILNAFTVTPEENYFEFPYDWRRDNRVAARRLARHSLAWLEAWRQKSGARNARLILVAHSMGGLIARHFLEVLDGWRHTRMLVTFGTPFRGSVNALRSVVNGLTIAGVVDLSDAVRSWTSVYQLLPIYPCYDAGDGQPVRVAEARDIPNVDRGRAREGLQFHRAIDAAVSANEKTTSREPAARVLHTVVGNFQPTLQYARYVNGRVRFEDVFPTQPVQGDGTVPETSATPREMGTRPPSFPLAERHASLQNASAALDFLTTVVSRGAIDPAKFQGDGLARIALDIQDVYPMGRAATIRARCDEPTARLVARVRRRHHDEARDDREVYAAEMASDSSGFQVVDVPSDKLGEGTYRVTIVGGAKVGSASDVFLVA